MQCLAGQTFVRSTLWPGCMQTYRRATRTGFSVLLSFSLRWPCRPVCRSAAFAAAPRIHTGRCVPTYTLPTRWLHQTSMPTPCPHATTTSIQHMHPFPGVDCTARKAPHHSVHFLIMSITCETPIFVGYTIFHTGTRCPNVAGSTAAACCGTSHLQGT